MAVLDIPAVDRHVATSLPGLCYPIEGDGGEAELRVVIASTPQLAAVVGGYAIAWTDTGWKRFREDGFSFAKEVAVNFPGGTKSGRGKNDRDNVSVVGGQILRLSAERAERFRKGRQGVSIDLGVWMDGKWYGPHVFDRYLVTPFMIKADDDDKQGRLRESLTTLSDALSVAGSAADPDGWGGHCRQCAAAIYVLTRATEVPALMPSTELRLFAGELTQHTQELRPDQWHLTAHGALSGGGIGKIRVVVGTKAGSVYSDFDVLPPKSCANCALAGSLSSPESE
jgi:hypothetical protein